MYYIHIYNISFYWVFGFASSQFELEQKFNCSSTGFSAKQQQLIYALKLHHRNNCNNGFRPFFQRKSTTEQGKRSRAKFKINLITVVSSSAQELKAADK
jgi:hypothetical protein